MKGAAAFVSCCGQVREPSRPSSRSRRANFSASVMPGRWHLKQFRQATPTDIPFAMPGEESADARQDGQLLTWPELNNTSLFFNLWQTDIDQVDGNKVTCNREKTRTQRLQLNFQVSLFYKRLLRRPHSLHVSAKLYFARFSSLWSNVQKSSFHWRDKTGIMISSKCWWQRFLRKWISFCKAHIQY